MARAKKSAGQRAAELAARIEREVRDAAGAGLDAARLFLEARVRETLSVPAPRKKTPGGGYRATARAVPGAPPRKLTGRLRQSVASRMESGTKAVVGVGARGNPPRRFNYPLYHERKQAGRPGSGKHPFLAPTVTKWRQQLAAIVGASFTDALGG